MKAAARLLHWAVSTSYDHKEPNTPRRTVTAPNAVLARLHLRWVRRWMHKPLDRVTGENLVTHSGCRLQACAPQSNFGSQAVGSSVTAAHVAGEPEIRQETPTRLSASLQKL